jgi:prostaglandin-H2 D-isomerase / glutathione transferase
MNKPRLLYFDFAGSRGEECRIALHLAGIDFEDVRLPNTEWKAMKPTSPFGSMPILELPGKPPLAQSNAILCLIGRRHGLHPSDDFEAARHEALLNYAEELRQHIAPTLRISDAEQKRAAREELARGYLNDWGSRVERQIGDGPFLAGDTLQVADIKLYMIVRWFATGTVVRRGGRACRGEGVAHTRRALSLAAHSSKSSTCRSRRSGPRRAPTSSWCGCSW